MYVVMTASECAQVAKVGGLGDVIYGLSQELARQGHVVEIILPKYSGLRYEHIYGLNLSYEKLWVPWGKEAIRCTVWFGFVYGLRCFFIEPHSEDDYFSRSQFYGYSDDAERFAFFSKACLEFMLKSGKRPDIIHAHDWQTGLVPLMLKEIYRFNGMPEPRCCYTIHNFRHQGHATTRLLAQTGLNRPDYYLQLERLQDDFDPRQLNLMKGGIAYADFITTVSPRHAWEARHTDQGYGLGHTLFMHQDKFGGVLNGLDYDVWNPENDPLIPYHYSVDSMKGKLRNKRALRSRLLLQDKNKPLIAYVGRLDPQKGLHLIWHSLFYALQHNAQFVLLGSSPDVDINEEFLAFKEEQADNRDCHLEIGFDEELAHHIYAAADILIMPSIFEPCGLAQLIALRYGTVPVVRSVGGLADTVFDRDHSEKPKAERNGYSFEHSDEQALESALHRALMLYKKDPKGFRELIRNGMTQDFSWARSGADYVNIYEHIHFKAILLQEQESAVEEAEDGETGTEPVEF